MKVTFVVKTIPRKIGGGPLIIFKLANFLASKGYDVNILVVKPDMWARAHLPEVFRKLLVRLSVKLRPMWIELDSRIKKNVVFSDEERVEISDAIIATAVDTAEFVYNLPAINGKKYYLIQDYENWVLPDSKVQNTYGFGMTNITVSKWLSSIVDKYSISQSINISNGIDTSIFYLRKKLTERPPHSIVFQYRSNYSKGGKYAINVAKRVYELYDDVEINVISNEKRPSDFPEYFNFYQNISQEEVATINNNSTLFLCTSVDEGFGLPGLEAMACGCVVVSTDYTGVHEYAIDKYNALLSPVCDVNALVTNIQTVFENEELKQILSKNGINTGYDSSFKNVAKRFEKIIHK